MYTFGSAPLSYFVHHLNPPLCPLEFKYQQKPPHLHLLALWKTPLPLRTAQVWLAFPLIN